MPPRLHTEWIDEARAQLKAQTGLQAAFDPQQGRPEPDGLMRITDGHHHWTFGAVCKNRLDRVATLQEVKTQIQEFRHEGLLLTPYLTPELAQQCRHMGLPFLDAAGNAFLREEGLYVLVAGQKPDKAQRYADRPLRAFDKTGLRVVFALLAAPNLMQAPYRDLAKAAGVALGTVSSVLNELRQQGLLVEVEGQRRWIDLERVNQAWTINYPLRLRERLRVRRFAAKENDWWQAAHPEAFGGFWGGEVAVAKLMGNLNPKTFTVYLPEDRAGFLAKHRLRADPQGPIEVLDIFWHFPQPQEFPKGIAPPLAVHADLLSIGDPRTMEEARRLHDRYLA